MKHLSEDQLSKWIAGEATPDIEQHAQHCRQCAAEAERTRKALHLFRESYLRAESLPRPAWPARRLAFAGVAVAAIALLSFSLYRSPSPEPRGRVFVQIPYVIQASPYERTSVVRMNVPVAALIAAGFQIRSAGAGTSLPADVLMGQDGRALAVSLFPDSSSTGEIYK
jgi:hypothetical protein